MIDSVLAFIDHPPWYWGIGFVLAGLYLLSKGGDKLVDGSVQLAKKLGLAPAVIGATVVAFGTSAPELVVSITAAWKASAAAAANNGVIDPNGPAAIAIGNIVGSNIFNVFLILGITLCMAPIVVPSSSRRIDAPFLILATGGLIAACFIGGESAGISRVEAALLFATLIAFIVVSIRFGTGDQPEIAEEVTPEPSVPAKSPWPKIISGLVLLLIGGRICLAGAVSLAEAAGMSQRIIGLTIVAAGTSLPELFASLQATRRGHPDIALTNVLGSNIFNILCILGISGLLIPLPINQGTLTNDLWWMTGAVAVLLPALLWTGRMGRGLGITLLVGYVASLTMLLLA